MDSEAIEAAAARWLAKRQGDDWTQSDQVQLDRWLATAIAHRVAFIRLDAAWQNTTRLRALGAGVPAGVIPRRHSWGDTLFLGKHRSLAGSRRTAASSHRRWSVPGFTHSRALAASLVLALALTLGWQLWPEEQLTVFQTPVGGLNTVPLADGTKVTLSTDSLIRVSLKRSERRIELDKGEVFFDVAKDPARPFVVRVGDRRVVAVGTKFSVRRDAGVIRVVVTEGLVRFEGNRSAGTAPPLQLAAGAVARAAQTGVLVQERAVPEAEQLLSWRTGHVTFRDATLAEAVAEFNRYNSRKIVLADASVAGIRIGGSFRSDNVEAFVWLLQNGFPVAVEQRGDAVVLSGR